MEPRGENPPHPEKKKHLPSEMQGEAGIASSASSTFGDSWIFVEGMKFLNKDGGPWKR